MPATGCGPFDNFLQPRIWTAVMKSDGWFCLKLRNFQRGSAAPRLQEQQRIRRVDVIKVAQPWGDVFATLVTDQAAPRVLHDAVAVAAFCATALGAAFATGLVFFAAAFR